MKLTAYTMNDLPPDIQPAPHERVWMNNTPDKYAYRCLPLNIANSLGWQIVSDVGFEMIWNGGLHKNDVQITYLEGNRRNLPQSHFGSGIITFHVNALFRSQPGTQMLVTGPINQFIDGLHALSGVVETDWAPYTFTMNWRCMVPNTLIKFPDGFPVCQIIPLNLDLIESQEPEMRRIESDPELKERYDAWSQSRNAFIASGSPGWQKNYFTGKNPDGSEAEIKHRTRMRVAPFEDNR